MRILVAGGTSPLGEGVCRAAAKAGARVAISGEKGEAEALARAIGANALAAPGDGRSRAAAESLVGLAAERLGGIDGLAICPPARSSGRIMDTTLAEWDEIVAANPRATWLLIQAAQPHLAKTRGACVIVVPAEGLGPTSTDRATSPSLASCVHVGRIFAQELGGDGIRINILAAGRADEPGSPDPDIPLGHRPSFTQIGAAAHFLLSPDSSYISGTTITVDGGLIDGLRGASTAAGKGA